MTDDIDYVQLAGYLAGEASADEAARVRAWVAASADNAESFREFEAMWRTAPTAAATWNVDAAWDKVRHDFHAQPRLALATAANERPADTARWRVPPLLRTRWGLASAAVAVLAIGAAAFAFARRDDRVVTARHASSSMRQVATAKGQRNSVRLDDGTLVLLSVDSKLRFPSAFSRKTRDVYLDGEAFFDVAHDPGKPFVVHAAGAVTRVLGTKFALRAYGGDSTVRVAVAEGRVRLRLEHADSAAGAVLTHNQLGQLTPDGRVSVRTDLNVQRYMGWVGGRIEFEDAPLRDVLDELRHWYDVDFVSTDPGLDSLRFTAAFHQESLDVVTQAIARTLDLDVQRTGSAIVFSRHPRNTP